jgi:predicted ATPase
MGTAPIRRHYVAVQLLERGPFLEALRRHLARAAEGRGRMVLVAGEAGIGKTSLVTRFCDLNKDTASIAVGACDGLFTPRALGPLFDLARGLGGELHSLLRAGAGREELLDALLEQL